MLWRAGILLRSGSRNYGGQVWRGRFEFDYYLIHWVIHISIYLSLYFRKRMDSQEPKEVSSSFEMPEPDSEDGIDHDKEIAPSLDIIQLQ